MTNYLGYGFKAENIESEIDFKKVLDVLKPIEGGWINEVIEDYKNNPNLDVRELLCGDPYDSLADLLYTIITAQNPDIEDIFNRDDNNMGSSWLYVEPILLWEESKPVSKEKVDKAFINLILSVTDINESDKEIIDKYQIEKIFVDNEYN